MRYFEKISFEQFSKDICNDRDLYDNYELSKRTTKKSCGYDFYVIKDMVLHLGEIIKILTGYKANFNEDKRLMLAVRSRIGFKYNVRMCN